MLRSLNCTELHQTHANLPSHVDETRSIEDLLGEHEVINTQFTTPTGPHPWFIPTHAALTQHEH